MIVNLHYNILTWNRSGDWTSLNFFYSLRKPAHSSLRIYANDAPELPSNGYHTD